jgi:pantoate kinase
MKAVNLAGEDALKAILKRPTLEEFMAQSKKFTIQTSLASDWALDA